MSPIAVESLSAPATTKGPALVIGSLSTAQNGVYQSVITDLEGSRRVDKQLLDRIVDNGMPPYLSRKYILLTDTHFVSYYA
jgi:hypothetical protein